jgi:tetratricopeptide (TPR) repeat protein
MVPYVVHTRADFLVRSQSKDLDCIPGWPGLFDNNRHRRRAGGFRSALKLFVAVAILILVRHASTFAAAQELSESQPVSDVVAAQLLIQAGRYEDAKAVLAYVIETDPENNDAYFLLGMIAASEKNYDEAIRNFRLVLTRVPDAERVRLEMARAFFLAGDYENAARNFRFARAGDLPDDAIANVDQFLGAIARLKRWSYTFSLALAQDTNVNAATDLNEVDIFGLPFVLTDDAKKKSGYGVSLDAGVEWSPLLVYNVKGLVGGYFHRTEYGGGSFDDMTVSGYAGPQLQLPRWQLALLGTGFQRWFGNNPYNSGVGGRFIAAHALTPQLQFALNLDAQNITYKIGPDQSGWAASLNLRMIYTVSPSSTVQIAGGLGTRDAKVPSYSSTTNWIGAGYYRDIRFGFSVYLEPSITWIGYYGPLAAFGKTRKDWIWSVRAELLNRRIEYLGFTPRLIFVYANQTSTIPLYDYARSQLSIGLTRRF